MSVLIIAEAGVNHNGNLETAKNMIKAAAKAGADIVKFQTFNAAELVSKHAEKADYQKQNTDSSESQKMMLEKLSLSKKNYEVLMSECKNNNIQFLSTPFDIDSINFLNGFNMPFWKIPSGEITNLPYLKAIADTKKPVVLSTGMSNMEEINSAVKILKDGGAPNISLLHCNTQYPTPFEDVNLNAMKTIKNETGLTVGYSDHTLGIEVSIAAVAMGAEIIEKHFTLDKTMPGPDHRASLEPNELKAMIQAIRNIEKALGTSVKEPSRSEKANIAIARKSIIAKKNICAGEEFTEDNLTTKRPGNGISPMCWYEILGSRAIKDFEEDELIEI